MRNQIIKSIKVSGPLLEALSAAAPGNFIRIHRTISPLSPDKCLLLPAGTRRGALPAPALQDGGLCFSSAASARQQNPPHAHPRPSPITAPGTRGAGTMCCPFRFSFVRSFGKEHPLELDRSHRPFSPHLFPSPPSSDAISARPGCWLIIHQQLLLKQPQAELKKPLRLQDINSNQHQRQM